MAKLFPQALSISAVDVNKNRKVDVLFQTSNIFMMILKYERLRENKSIVICGWHISNQKWQAGNTGLNSGAQLHETIQELKSL